MQKCLQNNKLNGANFEQMKTDVITVIVSIFFSSSKNYILRTIRWTHVLPLLFVLFCVCLSFYGTFYFCVTTDCECKCECEWYSDFNIFLSYIISVFITYIFSIFFYQQVVAMSQKAPYSETGIWLLEIDTNERLSSSLLFRIEFSWFDSLRVNGKSSMVKFRLMMIKTSQTHTKKETLSVCMGYGHMLTISRYCLVSR